MVIDSGRVFNIYSGHGDTTGYSDYVIDYGAEHINTLTNGLKQPICVTHACLTNDYAAAVSGGESWIRKSGGPLRLMPWLVLAG